ncbi:MAG: hypothetical protein QOK26_3374, partial [Pseudonocardiales bacterium]|nr:hypothetical protein [Pseudonocardiales bacterium]
TGPTGKSACTTGSPNSFRPNGSTKDRLLTDAPPKPASPSYLSLRWEFALACRVGAPHGVHPVHCSTRQRSNRSHSALSSWTERASLWPRPNKSARHPPVLGRRGVTAHHEVRRAVHENCRRSNVCSTHGVDGEALRTAAGPALVAGSAGSRPLGEGADAPRGRPVRAEAVMDLSTGRRPLGSRPATRPPPRPSSSPPAARPGGRRVRRPSGSALPSGRSAVSRGAP